MFLTYLFRELSKRKKQNALISIGLAFGIALVVVVSAVSGGIKAAQAEALSGLYGIGTDISVTKTTDPKTGPKRFHVEGSTSSKDSFSFSKARLEISPFTGTLTSSEVSAIATASGVKNTVATLKLTSLTFSGTLPTFDKNQAPPQPGTNPQTGVSGGTGSGPSGGSDGKGGSDFKVDSFSVEGVTLETNKLGPLAAVEVTEGRLLNNSDKGERVAVLDSNYATSSSIEVNDQISLGGKKFTVVGILKSTSTAATTPSNVYIPLDVAQTLSGQSNVYTNVYVAADSAANLESVKSAIQKSAPKATVATSAELASKVTGSISSAAELVNVMGGWLSFVVLLAAFGLAILFTSSGVARRTREFGTLKAIGWRSRRVVAQVMGESIVTGLLGGLIGIALGVLGIWIVNNFAPSLTASISAATGMASPGGPGGPGGPGMIQESSVMSLALHANLDPTLLATAIGIALLGGVLAGVFGGLRAAKLSPASALRSVE